MGAWGRRVAAGLALLLVTAGCSVSRQEPGLFPRRETSATPTSRGPVEPTNPALPVLGETEWVTGEGLQVTVRFALHAVRRVPGATVVDWSVTPLAAPGLRSGDDLPSWVDLGLGRSNGGDVSMFLLDPASKQAFRTLAHRSRRQFNRCLCTPLWLVQQDLRLGETRLLQATFAALPAGLTHVDVQLLNSAPWVHVPITPVGQVPTALRATDLSRPAEPRQAGSAERVFRYRLQPQRAQSIRVERVVAYPGGTSLEWTITSLTDQGTFRLQPYAQPVTADPPTGVEIVNDNPVSGPGLRLPDGDRRGVRWMTARFTGRTAYECLCSDLGLWATSLRQERGQVHVASHFPAVPAGTPAVDVLLPGADPLTGVLVQQAPDAAALAGPPVAATTGRWSYFSDDPPRGWATSEWPTPTPDPVQFGSYRGTVEAVTALPRS